MKKNRKPAVIVLNVVAIIFAIYSLVKAYMSYTYISSLVAQGLVVSQELLNVVDYYVTNSSPYVFYALAIWGIGQVIKKLDNLSNSAQTTEEEKVEEVSLIESEVVASEEPEVIASEECDIAEFTEVETVKTTECDK